MQQGGGKSRLDQRLNKVLKDDGSPKQSMLGKPWLTDSLLKAGGEDCRSQSLPRWFLGWLDDNDNQEWVADKWAPKKAPDSDRVKAVLVTPDRDGDCMIRCFFMGAFESFPDRIQDLVRLLTTTPCRDPNHTMLAKSHAWCVSAVAEGGGADRIYQAIGEGDIGWWARDDGKVDWALCCLARNLVAEVAVEKYLMVREEDPGPE